jgi:hypothetical protein
MSLLTTLGKGILHVVYRYSLLCTILLFILYYFNFTDDDAILAASATIRLEDESHASTIAGIPRYHASEVCCVDQT